MAHYLMGIDLGTSSVRAGIYREDGACLAMAAHSYPIDTPAPDRAEQNPIEWWNKTCECIRETLQLSSLKGSEITGISFSGQTHGTVLLDTDGTPVAPAIIWPDARSRDECGEIESMLGKVKLTKILKNHLFPGTQLTILPWIRKYDRKLWRKIRHVLLPKDYLRYKMCGFYNTEPSDASCTLLFDVGTRDWSDDLLKALDIPIEWMPYVVNSDQRITETSGIEEECGIPDGIPLVMGGSDQPCAALASGILNEGSMLLTIGTGGQLFSPAELPLESPGLSLNTFCHLPESRWYVMGATLAGGLCLKWFRDTFYPGTDFETLSHEASTIPGGAEGLTFLPYIAGRRSPELDPSATGTFSGIRLNHSKGHYVRAVMEGVAMEMHDLYSVMQDMGLKAETIICSGGATKSEVWMQILADTFDRPMSISDQDERSCFGAALMAGIGSGVYRDYPEAVSIVSPPSRIVEPENRRSKN